MHNNQLQSPLDRRSTAKFLIIFLPIAACVFYLTHIRWPFTLPVPWADEAWFMIPAMNLASSGHLAGDRMLVDQIYWMPVNFYLPYSLAFLLTHEATLSVARAVSFVLVTASTVTLWKCLTALVPRSLNTQWLPTAFTCAWFITAPVVFAADILRPDPCSLLLATMGLYFALLKHSVAVIACALLSLVTHPLEAVPNLTLALITLLSLRHNRWKRWELLILALALGIAAWEVSRYCLDTKTYTAQFVFQIHRKTDRHFGTATILVVCCLAVLLPWTVASERRPQSAYSVWSREGKALCFALSCIFIRTFGQEMSYFPWTLLGFTIFGTVLFSLAYTYSTFANTIVKRTGLGWPAMIVLCGLVTWFPLLRPQGIYGFSARPSVLNDLEADRSWTRIQLASILGREIAHPVLLSPFLYAAFFDPRSNPEIYTYIDQISNSEPPRFSQFISVKFGYPQPYGTLENPLGLDRSVCSPAKRLESPKGYVQLDELELGPAEPNSRSLSCKPIQPANEYLSIQADDRSANTR